MMNVCFLIAFILIIIEAGLLIYQAFVYLPHLLHRIEFLELALRQRGRHHK